MTPSLLSDSIHGTAEKDTRQDTLSPGGAPARSPWCPQSSSLRPSLTRTTTRLNPELATPTILYGDQRFNTILGAYKTTSTESPQEVQLHGTDRDGFSSTRFLSIRVVNALLVLLYNHGHTLQPISLEAAHKFNEREQMNAGFVFEYHMWWEDYHWDAVRNR